MVWRTPGRSSSGSPPSAVSSPLPYPLQNNAASLGDIYSGGFATIPVQYAHALAASQLQAALQPAFTALPPYAALSMSTMYHAYILRVYIWLRSFSVSFLRIV